MNASRQRREPGRLPSPDRSPIAPIRRRRCRILAELATIPVAVRVSKG